LMLYKNVPNDLLKYTMTMRLLFDYLAAFQLFVTGKPKNALSVMKARTDFNKTQSEFDEKRNENLLYSTKDNQSDIYQSSIVFDFYFKRKKTFKSLQL